MGDVGKFAGKYIIYLTFITPNAKLQPGRQEGGRETERGRSQPPAFLPSEFKIFVV